MTSNIIVGRIDPLSIIWQSVGEDYGTQDLCLTAGQFLSRKEMPFGFITLSYAFKTC